MRILSLLFIVVFSYSELGAQSFEMLVSSGDALVRSGKDRDGIVNYQRAIRRANRNDNVRNVYSKILGIYDRLIDVQESLVEQSNDLIKRDEGNQIVINQYIERVDTLKTFLAEQQKISNILRIESEARRFSFRSITLTNQDSVELGLKLGYLALDHKEQLEDLEGPLLIDPLQAFGQAVYAHTKTSIGPKTLRVTNFAWSPNQQKLIYVYNQDQESYNPMVRTHQLKIYQADTGDEFEVNIPETPPVRISEIAFSPDGTQFAVGCKSGAIYTFDEFGRPLHQQAEAHQGTVVYLHYLEDGNELLSSGSDKVTKIWNTSLTQERKFPMSERSTTYKAIDFNQSIFTVESGAYLYRSNKNNPQEFTKIPMSKYILDIKKSIDSQNLIASDGAGNIQLLDMGTGTMNQSLNFPGEETRFIGVNTTVSEYFLVQDNRRISFFNTDWSPIKNKQIRFPKDITDIALHPNDSLLLIGLEHGESQLWDLSLDQPALLITLKQSNDGTPVRKVTFSPNGAYMATLNEDGELIISRDMKEQLRLVQIGPEDFDDDEKLRFGISAKP